MPDVASSSLVTVVTSTSINPLFQETSVAATAVIESTMVSSIIIASSLLASLMDQSVDADETSVESSNMVGPSQSPAAPGGEVPASQMSEAIIGVVVVVVMLVAVVVGAVVVAAALIVRRVKSGVKTYTGVYCLFYVTITYSTEVELIYNTVQLLNMPCQSTTKSLCCVSNYADLMLSCLMIIGRHNFFEFILYAWRCPSTWPTGYSNPQLTHNALNTHDTYDPLICTFTYVSYLKLKLS